MVQNNEKRAAGRPRQFNREEVLDIVVSEFWERGYDGADIKTLSERTGLSKPSLYNAFGSKEDLFVSALAHYHERRRAKSRQALEKFDNPAKGIESFFLDIAQNASMPENPGGCLIMSIAIPLLGHLPKVAAFFSEGGEGDYKSEYLQRQIRHGRLPKNFNIAAATSLMSDFSSALFNAGRAGVPLDTLKSKAPRFTNLVLLEGNGIRALKFE